MPFVILGLDPRIHAGTLVPRAGGSGPELFRNVNGSGMDGRVKSDHDDGRKNGS